MKGLELAKLLYETEGKQALKDAFPELYERMAVGLVGEGSECFGFDDEQSADHDYGPSFCIWLNEVDYRHYGEEVQEVYDNLKIPDGYSKRNETNLAGKRVGVFSLQDWYRKYTGYPYGPRDWKEWIRVPESNLATATNGEVYTDPMGMFSDVRKYLLGFYPEDVRLKKMARRCAEMAREGQYNYPRSVIRGEMVAAELALAKFTEAAMSMIYLLNKKYAPYYKWTHRGLKDMEILPRAYSLFDHLIKDNDPKIRAGYIERICILIEAELKREDLSQAGDTFIQVHAIELMKRIENPQIRAMHILMG